MDRAAGPPGGRLARPDPPTFPVIVSPDDGTGWPRRVLSLAWIPIIVAATYLERPPPPHPMLVGLGAAAASAGWVVLVLRPAGWGAAGAFAGALATVAGGLAMIAVIGNWSSAVGFCFVGVASAGGRLPRPAASALLVAVAAGLTALLGHRTGLFSMTVVLLLLVMALVAGIGRRDTAREAEQRELALVAATRATEEHARAAALAERARLARDVHDALAHSLSALAVQLQGARLLVLRDGAPPDTLAQVERAQRLAVDGLAEVRRAVSALRTEPVSLTDGLAELVEAHPGARLEIDGRLDGLDPVDRETVLRVVQESLSNARRHAPNAPVTVRIGHADGHTELLVADHPGKRAAQADPGGYGLVGMAERAALIGAEWDAGPTEDGWQTRLRIPR